MDSYWICQLDQLCYIQVTSVVIGCVTKHSVTRPLITPFVCSFHLLNKIIFNIGIFPWMMLASTTIFFSPGMLFNCAKSYYNQTGHCVFLVCCFMLKIYVKRSINLPLEDWIPERLSYWFSCQCSYFIKFLFLWDTTRTLAMVYLRVELALNEM